MAARSRTVFFPCRVTVLTPLWGITTLQGGHGEDKRRWQRWLDEATPAGVLMIGGESQMHHEEFYDTRAE